MSTAPLAHRVATLTLRVLLVVAAWLVLVEGEVSALVFGAPVIALAILARYAVAEAAAPRIRPWGLARFAWVFFGGMVRGGFDVAWRALSPRLPVSPGWLLYEVSLAGDAPRRLLMMLVSVMPGTICVDVEGTKLRLHLLVTSDDDLRRQVEALEESIARLFGEVAGKEA
jgi:multicomponent Na+:H+ antiporter subunit E